MQSYTVLLSTQHNNTDPHYIDIYEKYRHWFISMHQACIIQISVTTIYPVNV